MTPGHAANICPDMHHEHMPGSSHSITVCHVQAPMSNMLSISTIARKAYTGLSRPCLMPTQLPNEEFCSLLRCCCCYLLHTHAYVSNLVQLSRFPLVCCPGTSSMVKCISVASRLLCKKTITAATHVRFLHLPRSAFQLQQHFMHDET